MICGFSPPTGSARQQPEWDNPGRIRLVREILANLPGLVTEADVCALRSRLAQVATGAAEVIQAGDCAENPSECTADHVARKVAVLGTLADAMNQVSRRPVLRAGRIAGQFAKPRSRPVELADGVELWTYRGHMVNGPGLAAEERRPDPLRMLTGYMAASEIMAHLGWQRHPRPVRPVWTSHEALLLDYELPMLRGAASGVLLASTHWPWIGDRTRQTDGAHVAMLSRVINPVAVKIGPDITPDELRELCWRLDPDRRPGRLTLIIRLGAGRVGEMLPGLVRAVRSGGHPVVWLTDPMHGNTVITPSGYKTRYVSTLKREIRDFKAILLAAGEFPGGVHLETTPEEVTECVVDESEADRIGEAYTSLCDPRLSPGQALDVLTAWGWLPRPLAQAAGTASLYRKPGEEPE